MTEMIMVPTSNGLDVNIDLLNEVVYEDIKTKTKAGYRVVSITPIIEGVIDYKNAKAGYSYTKALLIVYG